MMLNRRQAISGSAAAAALAKLSDPDSAFAQAREKAKAFNLKIQSIKTFTVAPRSTFVKIYTNQDIVGLGNAHHSGKEMTVAAAIMQNAEFLVGKDPTNIERIWEDLYQGPRWRGGPLTAAISAIDIALWDILGQAVGQPIYKLLGGAFHDRIRVYGGGGGLTPESWAKTKADGFTASRVGWPPGASVREMIDHVKAMRAAVGPRHELAVHGSGIFPTSEMVQFMRGVEDCDLMWVEEPIQMDDIEDWAHLRAHTSTPIATGERVQTKWGFQPYIQRHLIDFAQPDICACGGITEARKIAALAQVNRVRIAPHGPQGPAGAFANFHFDAATPNFYIQEIRDYRIQADLDMHEGLVPNVHDGYCDLPDRPGLGTVLNERVALQRGLPTYQTGSGVGLGVGISIHDRAASAGRGGRD
jgi:L-alanine-DL-glutamate epimerase-like enolase superfamily enzyme